MSRLAKLSYEEALLTTHALALEPPFLTLARYFSSLDRFDVDGVVACFTDDVVFGHPQVKYWKPESPRPLLYGRDAVRAFMLEYRKKQDSHHRLTGFGRGVAATGSEFVDGGDFFFATVTGRNGDHLAAVCVVFEVDSEALIKRYAPHTAPPSYNLQTSTDYISQYSPTY
jgi:ketosteroid isomerase-like protein